jgi:arabinofuranosyltransferase
MLLVVSIAIAHRDTAVVDRHGQFVPLSIVDDAYIYARYGRNLLRGGGLVYDPQEPTDGMTSVLWEGVVVTILAAGSRLERWLPVVGNVSLVLLLLLGCAFLGRRHAGWWAVAIMAAAAWNPVVSFHAAFGLETELWTLLLVAMLTTLFEWGERPIGLVISGLLAGLATLARPESGLWMLVAAASLLLTHRLRWRGAAIFVGTWGASVLPSVAARWWYFGVLVPNTFHAKVSGDATALAFGVQYVWGFCVQQAPLIITFLLASWMVRHDRAGRLIAVLAAAQTLYVILVGGDYFPLYRLLEPVVFLLYLQVGLAVPRLIRRGTPAGSVVTVLAVLVVAAGTAHVYLHEVRNRVIRDTTQRAVHHVDELLAAYLNAGLPPGESVAVLLAGHLPYLLDAPVIDMLGLNSRTIAREGHAGPGYPGHRQAGTQYVLQRRPAVIYGVRETPPPVPLPAVEELQRSPEFAALYRPVHICVPDGTGRWAELAFHLRRDLPVPSGGIENDEPRRPCRAFQGGVA